MRLRMYCICAKNDYVRNYIVISIIYHLDLLFLLLRFNLVFFSHCLYEELTLLSCKFILDDDDDDDDVVVF